MLKNQAFDEVFNNEAIKELLRIPVAAPEWDDEAIVVHKRALIIEGGASCPEHLKPYRVRWIEYIGLASSLGLLDDDLRNRLRSPDPDQFRGALAELQAMHFFGVTSGWAVTRYHSPSGKQPDFRGGTRGGNSVVVECKAAYVQGAQFISGDDSAVLRKCMDVAFEQLKNTQSTNILFLAPRLRIPVRQDRNQLVKAFIGDDMFFVPIDTESGEASGSPEVRFVVNGALAKLHGAELKPRFTRLSAVVCLEDCLTDGRVESAVAVIHNPYAPLALNPEDLRGCTQLVRRGDAMYWQ